VDTLIFSGLRGKCENRTKHSRGMWVEALFGLFIEIRFIATFTQRFFNSR
jgi:hypothetical protein